MYTQTDIDPPLYSSVSLHIHRTEVISWLITRLFTALLILPHPVCNPTPQYKDMGDNKGRQYGKSD